MASVLFFAGVGTKSKGRRVRQAMLGMAFVLFVGGVLFTISLPQNVRVAQHLPGRVRAASRQAPMSPSTCRAGQALHERPRQLPRQRRICAVGAREAGWSRSSGHRRALAVGRTPTAAPGRGSSRRATDRGRSGPRAGPPPRRGTRSPPPRRGTAAGRPQAAAPRAAAARRSGRAAQRRTRRARRREAAPARRR